MSRLNVDICLYAHSVKSHGYQVEVHSTPAHDSHLPFHLPHRGPDEPSFLFSVKQCYTNVLSTHSEHYLQAIVPSAKAQRGAPVAVIVAELAQGLGAKMVKLNADEFRATAVLIIPDSATSVPEEGHFPPAPVERPPDESGKVTYVPSTCMFLGEGEVVRQCYDDTFDPDNAGRASPTHEPPAKRSAHD
jgi:hypothetical protein